MQKNYSIYSQITGLAFKMIKYFLKCVLRNTITVNYALNPKWALWSDKFQRHSSRLSHKSQCPEEQQTTTAQQRTSPRSCELPGDKSHADSAGLCTARIQYTQRPAQDRYTPPFKEQISDLFNVQMYISHGDFSIFFSFDGSPYWSNSFLPDTITKR